MIPLLLAQLVVGQIVWNDPKLLPAEAARILTAAPGISNRTFVCGDCDGPRVIFIGGSTAEGPFGKFAPFPPARRLDRTDLRDAPAGGYPIVYPTVVVEPTGN
jgi:hypothetical protein